MGNNKLLTVWLIFAISCSGHGHSAEEEEERDRRMHPIPKFSELQNEKLNAIEDTNFWISDAQEKLKKKLDVPRVNGVAKNVIFYLGDGMSISTVTAARIFKGQVLDHLQFGEEAELYMESLPFTGFSKTFCANSQVADSACSATAYLCGIKANDATIGVTSKVLRGSCAGQADPTNQVSSVLSWAQAAGKSTGIVTTTRVTHASPAGTYSHIADRDWENDGKVKADGENPKICEDIATQLIKREPGIKINVILGGGRQQFTPKSEKDAEFPTLSGYREDGVNLIDEWISMKNSSRGRYVSGRDQLLTVDPAETDYLLGLFDPSHVSYYDQQLANNDPTLEEMTEAAIKILGKNPNGFFLFVEGGRIDHAHHDNFAHRAMTIRYPPRGTEILGFPPLFLTTDLRPYNTLFYANGPGPSMYNDQGRRRNILMDHFYNRTYQVPSPVPLESETHGGDDVLIFAKGPYAHLYVGTHQQSYIPHVIGFSACLGDGAKSPLCKDVPDNNGATLVVSGCIVGVMLFFTRLAVKYSI
ncbi:Alkaline phosphatase [Folsomia candida]|uniref:Alkaline phosphatase n=1 Tax=Folsomia candida TaxID=158441 RepID=A0A226DNS5_FOLCA|nr:Alkaline phosphatase [Folsomia candida]